MRKSIVLLISFFIISISSIAQTIDPSVIASASGSAKTAEFSLEWTLGEFSVETISSAAKLYTQGFNQPSLSVAVTTPVTPNNVVYNISVAPNPVLSILNFSISSEKNIQVLVTVADIRGVILMQKTTSSSSGTLKLNFNSLPPGTYTLTVRDGAAAHVIKTYQIIKL